MTQPLERTHRNEGRSISARQVSTACTGRATKLHGPATRRYAAEPGRIGLPMAAAPRHAPAEQDEWLTVEEVCTELKISRRTLDRWRAPGQGPAQQADQQRTAPSGSGGAGWDEWTERPDRGHRVTSFDVRFWKIKTRKGRGRPIASAGSSPAAVQRIVPDDRPGQVVPGQAHHRGARGAGLRPRGRAARLPSCASSRTSTFFTVPVKPPPRPRRGVSLPSPRAPSSRRSPR